MGNAGSLHRLDSEIASLANLLQVYGTLKAAHPDAPPIRVLDEYARLDSEGKLLAHFEGMKASRPIFGADTLPSEYHAFDYGIRVAALTEYA